jgi:hypothetical protein
MDEQRIIELRDSLLPSQGEPFDCVAFARLVIAESRKAERERCAKVCEAEANEAGDWYGDAAAIAADKIRAMGDSENG